MRATSSTRFVRPSSVLRYDQQVKRGLNPSKEPNKRDWQKRLTKVTTKVTSKSDLRNWSTTWTCPAKVNMSKKKSIHQNRPTREIYRRNLPKKKTQKKKVSKRPIEATHWQSIQSRRAPVLGASEISLWMPERTNIEKRPIKKTYIRGRQKRTTDNEDNVVVHQCWAPLKFHCGFPRGQTSKKEL